MWRDAADPLLPGGLADTTGEEGPMRSSFSGPRSTRELDSGGKNPRAFVERAENR
jgi:hypothetical protein